MINNRDLKIAVVIVAYNPDKRLEQSINNLSKIEQITDVFIVDNSVDKNDIVISCMNISKKNKLISNHDNKGIAYAQNIGIYRAIKKGYKWVLTLDHDTLIGERFVDKCINYIINNDCSAVGIICSDYYDIGSNKLKIDCSSPILLEETISSGSLLNVDIYLKLGGMKELYFIDQVDNEYCYRLRRHGYSIVALPGMDMEHRLGQIEKRCFLGKTFYLYNQPPLRTYYRTRNIIYFIREYNDLSLRAKKIMALFVDFFKILIEKDSYNKIIYFCRGVKSGIRDKI